MVLSSTHIKEQIIRSVLDFSLKIDAHKKSGRYTLVQISEILAVAIEINNLISLLDQDLNRAGVIAPSKDLKELRKIKRVMELVFKYKSDLNSVSIDIGENLASTNRYMQRGMDYIFDNLARRDFVAQVQAPAQQATKGQAQTPRQQAGAQPRASGKTKSMGLLAPLMFLIVLGVAAVSVYNFFFDRPATNVASLVREYRSDRRLSSVARPRLSNELKVHGTNSVLNIIRDNQNHFKNKYPDIMLSVSGGDSGEAIRDLIDKKITLAASSRIPTASERKQSIKNQHPIADHKVALDSVVVFTHRSNPVSTLSVEDLKKIYSQDIITWKEASPLNRSDNKVARFSLSKQSGTYAFFNDRVMFSEPTSEKIIHVYDPIQMIQLVSANPNAIGFCSLSAALGAKDIKIIKISSIFNENGSKPMRADGSINAELIKRGEYPLTRYLYLVSAGQITDTVAKLIDYMRSEDSQAKLADYGLVGIY